MSNTTDIRWLVLAAAIALLAPGLWLLIRGLRGRRVGDHPTCARCGFDLRGAPEGSTRCPECGADTTARNATRVGTRRRRPWFAAIGALCLLLAIAGLGLSAARVDWRSHLPNWYVLYEARSGTPASRVGPIDQMLARDVKAPLSAGDRLALARAMIALQRDPANVWKPAWGGWVAGRMAEGSLPAADRDAFVANLFADCRVRLRPIIAEGQAMPVQVELDVGRGGIMPPWLVSGLPRAQLIARINTSDRRLTIDESEARFVGGNFSMGTIFAPGQAMTRGGETSENWRGLAPGPHRVVWSCPIIVRNDAPSGDATSELARHTLRWSGTVEVVAPGKQVRLVPDPSKADAVRAAFTGLKIRIDASPTAMSTLDFTIGQLPADAAFYVSAIQGDGPERRLGQIVSAANGQGRMSRGLAFHPTGLTPGTATLIFRPSVEAAAATVDVFEIWDGEIRIDDVPVVQE